MELFAYLALVVIGSVLAYSLAAKVPKQKPPTLQDFSVPTAEEGRSIPWIFGTYKITDPNIIWYGDLEVRTKTKDKVKTRVYRMGIQLECCIGPVDALVALYYGGKQCWSTEVTASGRITIDQPNLFGGRDKEGGIDGDFDICFGEPTQAINDYLLAQLGAPLSAFRDSLTIVGRKPNLAANTTYIKPLHPTVRCIRAGWADGACWYTEKAAIPDLGINTGEYDLLVSTINGGAGLHYRWLLDSAFATDLSTEEHVGVTGGSMPIKREAGEPPENAEPSIRGHYAAVPCGTSDEAAVIFGNNAAAYNAAMTIPYFIDGTQSFTLGVWLDAVATEYHVLTTNVDNPNGWYQGIWINVTSSGEIYVQFGDGGPESSTNRISYISAAGLIAPTGRHFFVLRWNTEMLTTLTRLTVFADGAPVTLSYSGGSGSDTAWSTVGTSPRIGLGCGFKASAWPHYKGTMDEAFLHLGVMSDEDIADMYATGTCNAAADAWDMNPAHMIYKVLTDTDQGLAEPSATIDDTSFRAAADALYMERMGLSTQWRNEGSVRDFLGEVCRHAGAVLSLDPQTGLTQMILLRDDYTAGSLDLLTEDHVVEVVEWQDAADGEAVNEVTVEYRERDGATGSVTWANRASIQQHGRIHETESFPMISRRALALRVAKRECLQRSSNLSKGKLRVNRAGWDKLPGAVFRFSHGPEKIDELVLRVVDIDLGTLTDGAITISVVQDIFSLGVVLDVGEQDNGWTAPDTAPAAAPAQAVLEAPYWQLLGDLGAAETAALGAGAGYLIALAGKPTGASLDFDAWARISPASYAEALAGNVFAPTATLTAALDRQTDADIALAGAVDLDLVEAGWIAVIGAGAAAELCLVLTIDTTANTMGIARGRADTTPQAHTAGARVWFLDANTVDWPRLPTQWADGNMVDVKVLPVTGAGVLPIASATAVSATLASRQVRPYPPGYLEIDAVFHPTLIEGAFDVTWAHRDRLTQGATLVSQYDATDYGPEASTTYNGYAYDDDTITLLDSVTGLTGKTWTPTISVSCTVRIEIESARGGYASWQRQVRVFDYIATGTILTEASDYLLTEAGDYLTTET